MIINTLISLYMIKNTGANLCKSMYYNYLSEHFSLEEFLGKYESDLNKSVKTLSFVAPSFVESEFLPSCYNLLARKVTKEELILVTNRMKEIKVKKGIFSLTKGGHFNNSLNTIKVYDLQSLMHEFLHMASSYYDKENKIWMCGFVNRYKFSRIGLGLTEGFTELFASRFEERKAHSYQQLTQICEMLELFFDKAEDVRKMYFSCDLSSFINKLRECMSEEEIFNLIREMDLLVTKEELKRAYDIKYFIYKKFINKHPDSKKLEEMKELISKHGDQKRLIEAKNLTSKSPNIEEKNIASHFKYTSRRSLAKAATTVALCTSLLLGNHALSIKNQSLKTAQDLVGAHKVDSYSVLLEDYYLSYDNLDNSVTGNDLCTSLIKSGIKYFELNGEYYTQEGGELTIETCEITVRKYLEDATPIYHNGIIVNYVTDGNLKPGTYEIIDGKIYALSYIKYNQATLPDDSLVTPVHDILKDIDCSYSIGIIDKKVVNSKSYDELKDLFLVYENSQNEETTHSLERKH